MTWELSEEHRAWLRERMQTTGDARECRRCSALLRIDEGYSVSAVAREFGVSRQTLQNWRGKSQELPLQTLQDQQRSGRPSVWDEERVETLKHLLTESPRQHEF